MFISPFINNGWPAKIKEQCKPYFRRRNELCINLSCLLWGNRVLIVSTLWKCYHWTIYECHPGIARIKTLARSYFWWPSLDEIIETCIKQCKICHVNKTMPASVPIHHWEWTTKPWVQIHIDFAGLYLGKMVVVLTDTYSKWMDIYSIFDI